MNRPRQIHSGIAMAAAAAAMGMAAQAEAVTLYISDYKTGAIYQVTNAGYTGSTVTINTATPGSNSFTTLTNAFGLTSADSSGDVIGVQYNGTSGTAHVYNSAGTQIGIGSK